MRGTVGLLGVNLPGLTGLALTVQNAVGGSTVISNSGTLGASPILGVSLTGTGSAPVVAAYGGGAVNFTNSGTVLGRIAFQANGTPGAGNTFTNDGTISGSVSLGAGSTNTFTAVTGSTLNDGGSVGLAALPVTGFALGFAATGTVDGGAGGNNSLVLSNSANNNTTIGNGTLNGASYVNFSQATVNGGTWTLNGPLAVTSTTLNGGLAIFNDPGSFGTGTLVVNGGGMQAANAGLSLTLPVTLGANGLTVSGSNPLAVSGVLGGTGGVSLTGTGSLTLSGANTYSGGTSLSSGTLIAGNNNALGSGAVQVSGSSAVLDAIGPLTLTNPIAVGGGSTLTFGGSAPLTLAGQISGSGNVVKQGAQTVTLTGTNTFSGGMNLAAGTLALSGAGTLQVAGTALTLSGSGAAFDISNANGDRTIAGLSGVANTRIVLGAHNLTLGNSASGAFAGVISGTGGIIKANGDTQTLSGGNTYTGGTTINAGGIALGAGGSLASTGAVSLLGSGTAFDISQAGAQTIGALSGVADSTVSLGAATLTFGDGNNESFGGSITGNGGIVKQGTGTQTLSGPNTFIGPIAIDAGTLSVGGTGTLSGNAVNVAGGAAFDISNGENQTIGALSGATGSAVNLGDNTLSFGDTTNQTFGGAINGNGGGIVKFGTGTQTLTGQQTFTGSVVVGGGALVVGAGGGLSSQSAVILGDNTTSLDISDAGAQTIGSLSGGAAQVQLGASILTFGDNTGQTFTGSIHGTGALIKQGAGVQTLTGASDFTGGVTVNAGGLALGTGGSLQAANALSLSGANTVFDIGAAGPTTVGALTGMTGSAIALGTQTLTFGDALDETFNGVFHGTGAVVKTGAGVQTLTGASDFTGGTTVNAGGLIAGNNLALGTGALNIANNATLDSTQAVTLGNNVNLTGTLTVLGTNDVTLNGVLAGLGGLTKTGNATLTLGGSNTYTGATSINAGTLALGAGASLNAAGTINVASGATLDLSAGNGTQTIGALDGAGTVNLGGVVTTLGDIGNDTFSGTIAGTGSLVKVDTGTQALTGQNTYTGGTTVQAGTLALSGAGALASSGALTLSGTGATFDISSANGPRTIGALSGVAGSQIDLGANTLTFSDATGQHFGGVISGTGGIVKQGTGSARFDGVQLYTGTTTVTDGALFIGRTGSLAAGARVVVDGVNASFDLSDAGDLTIGSLSGTSGVVALSRNTLTFGDASDETLAAAIQGYGNVVKQGTGTQTLTGENLLAGMLTVADGAVVLGAGGSLLNMTDVTLDAGTSLDVSAATAPTVGALNGVAGSTLRIGATAITLDSGNNGTFGGTLSGPGGIVKQGSGTQTLSGGMVLSGTVQIDAGTLALRGGTQLDSAAVGLNGSTSVLDVAAGPTQVVSTLTGVAGSVIGLDHATLSFGTAGDNTLASDIHGAGGQLVKVGNGVQTLSGNSDFSGGMNVQAGGILVGSNAALGTGTVTFADATSLDATQATTLGNQIRLNGNLDVLGTHDLTLNGAVVGGGGITKNGSATLTLNGENTYIGATNVNAGTLALGAGASLDSGGVVDVQTGATFDLSAGNGTQTFGALTGGGAINMGGNVLEVGSSGADETFSGGVAGSGSLVKMGTGVETMTGSNTFTGGTVVQAGTLSLAGAGTLATTGAMTLQNAGATLDISGANGGRTIGALTAQAGTNVTLGNNTLTFGDVSSHTVNGTISGTGGIVKQGSGTQTLTGQQQFTGTTTIDDGTLALGATGKLATGANIVVAGSQAAFDISAAGDQTVGTLSGSGGNVNLGGNTLTFGDGTHQTLMSAVNGTGGIVKVGAGTQTLTGQNTFSGDIDVTNGTLALGAGGALSGSNNVTLAGGTMFDVSQGSTPTTVTIAGLDGAAGSTVSLGAQSLTLGGAGDSTFDGVIQGTGGITKQGNATVTLGGNNRYSGGTTVNGGGVTVTSPAGLGTGGLTLTQGTVTTQGVDVTLPSLTGTTQGALAINGGSVTVSSGNFGGSVSGSGGLTKTGGGTLTLSGNNPITGPTTVVGGTLGIGNLGHSPVTVQAGGTLTTPAPVSAGGSGTGAQTGPLTGASGSQIVVSSPGTTLGVGGNLTLQPGSTLQVSVAPGTAPSQVNATGSASVGGSNLVVNAAPGTQPASASGAVIVSAANGVSGQFASTSTNLLYLSPQVSYTPTTALLSFTPNGTPLSAGGVTPNQKAVASAVSMLGTGSPLYQAALGLTADTAPAAFASLDGSLHASIASMLLSQSQVTRDAASQRLRDSLLFTDDCETGSHSREGELTTPPNDFDCRGQRRATQAWASVYGSDGQLRAASVASGGAGASTLYRRGMGVLVGVDTPVADTWRAGVLGGLGHDTFNTGTTASGNSNDAQMGAYVSRRFGHLGAMLGGSYALQQISSRRAVAIGPIAQTARASYDAATWQVFGEAAWRFDMGRAGIEPFATMAHAWVRTDAFNESGSAADLHADEQTRGITFSTLGVRGDLPFGTSTGTAALGRVRLSAGWRHAFGADTPDAQLAFVDSAAGFTVGGVPIARDATIVEAGIDAFVGQALTLGVSYTGQFGSQVTDNAFFGNLNWRF